MGRGGEVSCSTWASRCKIVDLARDLIRLSGFDPDEIRIVFTGLRPGEKLYEEPLADERDHAADAAPEAADRPGAAGHRDAVEQMVSWLERDRAAGRRRSPRLAQDMDSGVRAARRGTGPAGRRGAAVRAASRLIRIRRDQASTTPSSTIAAQACARSIASMQRGRGHSAIPRPQRRTHAISRLNNTR